MLVQPRDQRFERSLAFIGADNVDAIFQIGTRPRGRVGTAADDKPDAVVFGYARQPEDVVTGDDIGVNTDDLWPFAPHHFFEILRVAECRIEYIHGETSSLQ